MQFRVVHLDVEDCSEELLRQQSYAIKKQLGHPKLPTRGFGTQNTPIGGYFACSSLVLYGIRLLAKQFLETNLDIEVDHSAGYTVTLQSALW